VSGEYGRSVRGLRAVVTGATAGLGRETARQLTARGLDVTLAVRDVDAGHRLASELGVAHPDAAVRVHHLDLADLASVRAAADAIDADGPLDILINNAGLAISGSRRTTAQGFELHLGVNHLGHFVLTSRLLPALLAAPRARVVTVSSLTYRSAGALDPRWTGADPHHAMRAYAQSKLACALFGLELDRRAKSAGVPLSSVVVHPGWVASDLFRARPGDKGGLSGRLVTRVGRVLAARPASGARSQLRAALDVDLTGGELLGPRLTLWGAPRVETPAANLRDANSAQIVWELSEDRTGEHFAL